MTSTARIVPLVLVLCIAVLSSVDAEEMRGVRGLRPRPRVRQQQNSLNTLPKKVAAPRASPGKKTPSPSVSAPPSMLTPSPPEDPPEELLEEPPEDLPDDVPEDTGDISRVDEPIVYHETPLVKVQRGGKGGRKRMGMGMGGNNVKARNSLPENERSGGGMGKMKMKGKMKGRGRRRRRKYANNDNDQGELTSPDVKDAPIFDDVGSAPEDEDEIRGVQTEPPSATPTWSPSAAPSPAPSSSPTAFPTVRVTASPTYSPTTQYWTYEPTTTYYPTIWGSWSDDESYN